MKAFLWNLKGPSGEQLPSWAWTSSKAQMLNTLKVFQQNHSIWSSLRGGR